MSTTRRSEARTKGLRLAAKVATLAGVAVAALGLVEARATAAADPGRARDVATATSGGASSSLDDSKPLPMEDWVKAAKGGCGCAPCWGPPAPPERSRARGRRMASRASKPGTRRTRRGPR